MGAYYFSGWSHAQNNNITAILTGPMHSSEPLIGWYDDSQPQIDKSINQAADAGIDFWAFDWYDIARSPYANDKTLNEGLGFYLTSQVRPRLGFCIDFIDQAPFIPTAKDWPGLVKTWIKLFKQPGYVQVDGKPLFIVFSPEHMRDIFGSSQGVHQAITYLRAQARAAGLPGVAVTVSATVAPRANPYHVMQLNTEGYNVSTGYNYHAMGGEQYRVPVPYQRLVDENVAMWSRVADNVHVPYIPVGDVGVGSALQYPRTEDGYHLRWAHAADVCLLRGAGASLDRHAPNADGEGTYRAAVRLERDRRGRRIDPRSPQRLRLCTCYTDRIRRSRCAADHPIVLPLGRAMWTKCGRQGGITARI